MEVGIDLNRDSSVIKNRISCFLIALVRYLLLIGLSFIIIYPFITKISTMFMSEKDFRDPLVWLIPKFPTLEHLDYVIKEGSYIKTLIITASLSLGCALLQTASCTMVGYGLARFKFRGRGLLMGLMVFTIVIPPATLGSSIYIKFRFFDFFKIFQNLFGKSLNLMDTVWPLLILSITALGLKNGLYMLVMWQRFKGIPKELSEASYVDGANAWQTFLYVIMPQAKAMMISVFILSFAWQWTDEFYNKMFFNKIPVLSTMVSSVTMNVRANSGAAVGNAALILVILPLLIVYLFAQRFLIQGIEQSGLVG